ncbi:LysR family transcriptional regulator [Diaphorobacter ruginosibacter]|uniref:LysR family transcriptional regulator n=1 Tax=Diaphorobacter ruginosibacter TaxID=1715720 RepID=UPI00333E9C02
MPQSTEGRQVCRCSESNIRVSVFTSHAFIDYYIKKSYASRCHPDKGPDITEARQGNGHRKMKKTLPDFEAWAIFAKVAETGSFARAAMQLNLSQATISKAVSRLETRMNVMLLQRTPRSVSLTETGLAALERAASILEYGETIEAEITEQSNSLRGLIRISLPMSFGVSRLSPILSNFLTMHPDVEMDVDFSDKQVDLIEGKFDFALRIAALVDSTLLARRLCPIRVLLVGSPTYFRRHGKPQHPRDLANHRTLRYAYAHGRKGWNFSHEEYGNFTQVAPVQMRSNNAEALNFALLAGLGIALQPEFLVWDDLQSGQLETAMETWKIEPLALHIVAPPGRRRPLRVQILIDYILQTLTQEPWARLEPQTQPLIKS